MLENIRNIENSSAGIKIVRPPDVADILTSNYEIEAALESCTPNEILSQTEFELPEMIFPANFPNFRSLHVARERIRNLKLVPVKTVEDQANYHAQSYNNLKSEVLSYFNGENLAFAPNRFPYFLPADLQQYIVWVQDPYTENQQIFEFIARIKKKFSISDHDLILFERPKKTISKLVKGTLPDLRHIHFWTNRKL